MNYTNNRCAIVTQPGLVTAVHGSDADIEIVQVGACASCRLRGVCAPGDSVAKVVRVQNRGDLVPGMRVTVGMERRFGWLGVLFAFVLPLIIVVGLLFGLSGAVGSEEVSALIGIGALVPYFGGLYLMRDHFASVVHFEALPAGYKEGVS